MNKGQFYRNTEIFQNAWNLVALGVPQNSKQVILYFSGSEPYYSYVFQNAGLFPYALNKKIRNLGEFPVAVHDRQSLLDALCEGNTHRGLIPDSLLSSVYAFDINDYGYVRNSTEDVHTELIREFKANNCSAPI